MKKIRFFLRLTLAFSLRHRKLIFLGFFLGISSFLALPKLAKFLPRPKETKTIGIVGRYTPAELPLSIQNLISLGLTSIQTDGTPLPAIATGWEVDEEGKTYIFYLKNDVYFHDGKKLTARDINYNFRDVETQVLNEQTIRFRLKETFSPFPVVVSRPIFKKGFVGLGPYKVEKINRSGEFIDFLFLHPRNGGLANLHFYFYPAEKAAKTAFTLGEIREIRDLVDPSGFEGWKNVQITPKVRFDRHLTIFFNTEEALLEEKAFRQALAYALPKEKETNLRALSPLSHLSWAFNPEVKPYEQNLENTRKLLKKVLDEKKLELEKVNLKILTTSSLYKEAEKIKKAWEELGIKVEIGAISSPGEEFQIFLAIQEISPDPDQYSFWHSTQEGNITHFKNPRIDKLLEDGRRIQDKESRKKNYFDFQKFLVEEAPAIFLSHPTTYNISKK